MDLKFLIVLLVGQGVGFPQMTDADSPVDFQREIRPILSNSCFQCHGPDEESRESDLRLDMAESALESVIVPGKPEESELFARITADDESMWLVGTSEVSVTSMCQPWLA